MPHTYTANSKPVLKFIIRLMIRKLAKKQQQQKHCNLYRRALPSYEQHARAHQTEIGRRKLAVYFSPNAFCQIDFEQEEYTNTYEYGLETRSCRSTRQSLHNRGNKYRKMNERKNVNGNGSQ